MIHSLHKLSLLTAYLLFVFKHQIPIKMLIDELAVDIKAKPRPWKYLFSDPGLTLRLLLGPYVPAQYRLEGPGVWPGATQLIKSTMADIWMPLSPSQEYHQPAFITFLKVLATLLLGFWILVLLVLALWLF